MIAWFKSRRPSSARKSPEARGIVAQLRRRNALVSRVSLPSDWELAAMGECPNRRPQLSEATLRYLEWGLWHLRPFFSDWLLRDIDAEAVDAYRAQKVKDAEALGEALERGRPRRDEAGRVMRPLSPSSINKTIDVLQWLLSAAEEYGWIQSNPARGPRRRLRQKKQPPVYLDSVVQIETLLRAAGQLDADPESRIRDRLPLIATLAFAGLRAHELSALRWRDVELASGAFRSESPRRRRACVRSAYSRCFAASWRRTGSGATSLRRKPWSFQPGPDGSAARTTSEVASSRRRSLEQTSCSKLGGASPYLPVCLPTSCATHLPRSSSHVAKIRLP